MYKIGQPLSGGGIGGQPVLFQRVLDRRCVDRAHKFLVPTIQNSLRRFGGCNEGIPVDCVKAWVARLSNGWKVRKSFGPL